MKAKLTFVSFFAVVTLLAIPIHSQEFLKRIKPWLYPDDSLVTLGAKRMQPPKLPFGEENFDDKRPALFSNFSSPLGERQTFSDSVQALWVRHYASGLIPVDDYANAVAVDGSGNVYVSGYSYVSGNISSGFDHDYVTIKYNAFGAQQWVVRYNGPENSNDIATALAVDAKENVYVTGYSVGSGTSDDYATIKYNAAGALQWVARYNGPGYPVHNADRATALAVDTTGNVYVTGYSEGPATFSDYVTIKYNVTGALQWVARYNGPGYSTDNATALAVDAAGNVFVTGYSMGSGHDEYATIKYNTAGTQQWVARYSGGQIYNDIATALTVDATGNVYVTGYSDEGLGTSYDFATIKYNAAGTQLWVVRYNGPVNSEDIATALAVDATGNVYVTGYSVGLDNSGDYATIKYNAIGTQQWVVRYNGPENSSDIATALAVDATGNVYVTGYSVGLGKPGDYATIKYNTAGTQQWVARYSGGQIYNDIATALTVDATGNVYVTGYIDEGLGTSYDFATIKYNAAGTQQWVVRYNGPGYSTDNATALAVDTAGNVYVTGYSEGSGTSSDYATIKYNAAGTQQWVARYNGPENSSDIATALAVDATGNVYVTGYSVGLDNSDDYATIKYNAAGTQQWVARYNGPGNSPDEATALAVDAAGNVYVTGNSWGSGTSYDYATLKYSASGVKQWVARYNGPKNINDGATALAVDVEGNVYVTGYSDQGLGTSYDDFATIKYSTAGTQQWVARYNGQGNSYDNARALAVDTAGNVYVTGYSVGLDNSGDYATIKYNAIGTQQWVARYNGPGNSLDAVTALAVDAAGNVYVTGYSVGLGKFDDYATIKYNAAGAKEWEARYDGPRNSDDEATALAVDATGNVYVTGSTRYSSNQSVYTTIKYPQTASLLKANTGTATNATAASVTLNGTVNPNNLSMTVYFEYGTTTSYGDTIVASPNLVTGVTDVLVSANLSNLLPNTTYHYRIFATYIGGLIEGEDQTFMTLRCEASTTVSHTPPSSPRSVNNNIRLNANVLSVCGVDSVVLKYRRAGDADFLIAEKSDSAGSLVWTISASAVTSRGVEYFIAVTFFSGATTRLPSSSVFSIPITIAQGLSKGEEQPPGSEQNAYRLISMPLDLDDKSVKAVMEDNLGPSNKKKWRLFALNANQQEFVELPEFADTIKMDPGKAFLLIVKDPGKFIDTGAGKSNRTDKPFSIVLHPRWNFVGNPFNFPIPLEKLSVKSGNPFPLRYHEGTWRDPFLNKVSEIKPFEGYAVFSTLEVADTLFINPDLSSSTNSLAKQFASTLEEKMQWSIRILAQCQEAIDEDNTAAIISGASSSWDDLDQPEPPVIGEYVSVYFPHPEWDKLAKNYCTDIRPMTSDNGHRTSDGELWPFEIKTNIPDKVNLTFEGIDEVPKELEVWLVDDALKIMQNLRENNHYAVAGSEQPKQLKLVVGKHDFVGEKLAEAQAIPATYELSQNFPNPFNPATTIRYGLPKVGHVTLKIYNLLGEEVAIIMNDELRAAGYHAAIWDGRNHTGKIVASGVYIYRLQAGPSAGSGQVFVQSRKMILLQ